MRSKLDDTWGALGGHAEYLAWGRVMGEEFEALREAERAGEPALIDQYGALNPAEFFALVTEAFFERPHALRRQHPALYERLAGFYRQDPVRFVRRAEDAENDDPAPFTPPA